MSFLPKSCRNISGMARGSLNKNVIIFCVGSVWLCCYKGSVACAWFWGEHGNLASGDGPDPSYNSQRAKNWPCTNINIIFVIFLFTLWDSILSRIFQKKRKQVPQGVLSLGQISNTSFSPLCHRQFCICLLYVSICCLVLIYRKYCRSGENEVNKKFLLTLKIRESLTT